MLVIALFLNVQTAAAQERFTLEEAITFVTESDDYRLSSAARLTSLKLAQWADGQQQWNIYFYNEGYEHIFEIQRTGELEIFGVKAPANANANDTFWAEMPKIEDVTDPYLYLERAISDLAAFDPNLRPRDKFLIEYKVCGMPFPDTQETAMDCENSYSLENWSVILQAGRGFFRVATKEITYRDGQLHAINDIEVGDAW